MRLSFVPLALSALLLPAVAQADTFNFSAFGTGFNASGVLTATATGGSYTITGVTGAGITRLVPMNGDFSADNDNRLFPSGTRLLDAQGFAFNQTIGGTSYVVNLFSTAVGYEAFAIDAGFDVIDTAVTFTATSNVAATPEPSSWLLLGSGVFGLAATQVRKRLSV